MDRVVRALSVVFWGAAVVTVVWLMLNVWNSAAVESVFGDSWSSLAYTVLLGIMATCSGVILWQEPHLGRVR